MAVLTSQVRVAEVRAASGTEAGNGHFRKRNADFLGGIRGTFRHEPPVRPTDHANHTEGQHARRRNRANGAVVEPLLQDGDDRVLILTVEHAHELRPFRAIALDVRQVLPDVHIQQRVVIAV